MLGFSSSIRRRGWSFVFAIARSRKFADGKTVRDLVNHGREHREINRRLDEMGFRDPLERSGQWRW
jgi:hypothetical protein